MKLEDGRMVRFPVAGGCDMLRHDATLLFLTLETAAAVLCSSLLLVVLHAAPPFPSQFSSALAKTLSALRILPTRMNLTARARMLSAPTVCHVRSWSPDQLCTF